MSNGNGREKFPLKPNTPQDAGAWALAIKYGVTIFPIRAGAKFPPLIDFVYGPVPGSCNPQQWAAWAKEFPGCNWGVRTGVVDGHSRPLLVLDQDKGKLEDLPGTLPETFRVKTPNGMHHYFWLRPGERFKNSKGVPAKGWDIRAQHGYVVAPGSVVDGKRYKVENPGAPIGEKL